MADITFVENIVKETEKAILFDAGDRMVWVPKSIIEINDKGVVSCPIWFARKNGIGKFGYVPCFVG